MSQREIAEVISSIRKPVFPLRLHGLLGAAASFDWMSVIVFPERRDPAVGYCSTAGRHRSVIFGPYLEGGYAEDPFYVAFREAPRPGFSTLQDVIAAQGGVSTRYREILESAEVADEICFLAAEPRCGRAMVSMVRERSNGPFHRAEIDALRALEPVVLAALERHFERDAETVSPSTLPADPEQWTQALRAGLERLADGRLTARELEVTALVLSGHSSLAIGEILGIASGTVKIHRKNVHRKLSVSSQGELFSTFCRSLLGDARLSTPAIP